MEQMITQGSKESFTRLDGLPLRSILVEGELEGRKESWTDFHSAHLALLEGEFA
jgi:hypothetical protein